MSVIASVIGLVGIVYALRAIRRHWNKYDASFVTLHAATSSPILPPSSATAGSSLTQLIRDKVPALGATASFNGAWWLPGGHLQTMYCSFGNFSRDDPIVYERKHLQLPDGGVVAVDITPPLSTNPVVECENVLLVAHGLTGGSHESYVRSVLSRVTRVPSSGGLGMRAVVLNFRGCNGSPVVTPRLYHAGSSDDLRHVVLWISYTFPNCAIFGLGFSLGANILTKYAGEEGGDCPLQAIVGLANPWDFEYGHRWLPSTFIGRSIYRYALGGALRALLKLHHRVFLDATGLPVTKEALNDVLERRTITLGQYDTIVTAPMYGFKDALDYYIKISSSRVVSGIRIPCLAINSGDDPIIGPDCIPLQQIHDNPYVVLAVTATGGHMGWFENGDDTRSVRRWYVKPVVQFLTALVEYKLAPRPKPRMTVLGTEGLVRQEGCTDVGFRELTREQSELVVSGADESKLFTGW